ncbi:MAG: glycosyltransferase, partial [Clostridia bacterium]|nr:glycosyltransferase [Clostridia bacterium]
MKKKLLFVMESMGSGGGERSLLTLLQLIDYDKHSVDLMLFNSSGLFMDMIPEQVNIISFGKSYESFVQPFGVSLKKYLLKGNLKGAYNRFMYSKTVNGKEGSTLYRDQLAWKYMKGAVAVDLPEYDAAIGYLEGKPNFFVADCVKAKVKIAYIHSDYRKLEMDKKLDEKIFEKFDYVVGVSDKCADILREEFPDLKEKIRAVENITSPEVLRKMAEESAAEYENANSKVLLTIGRIAPPKGYDIAVDAAEILTENGA